MTDDAAVALDGYIHAIADVFAQTITLTRTLTEDQGALATACPGWSVKDNLAHMVGLEQTLSGSPHPDVTLPPLDHVVTDFDRYMEQQIQVRRALPLAAIADEMAGLAPRRIEQLRAQASHGDIEVASVLGSTRALSASLPIRAFDLWAHEQDIRRAVGSVVRMDCPAGVVAVDRTIGAWTALLAERVTADGELRVAIDDREPVVLRFGSGGSHASISMGGATATALGCGRGGLDDHLADVVIEGDQDLVAAVAACFAFTP